MKWFFVKANWVQWLGKYFLNLYFFKKEKLVRQNVDLNLNKSRTNFINYLILYKELIKTIFIKSNFSKATNLVKQEEDEDHWWDIRCVLLPIQNYKGMKSPKYSFYQTERYTLLKTQLVLILLYIVAYALSFFNWTCTF